MSDVLSKKVPPVMSSLVSLQAEGPTTHKHTTAQSTRQESAHQTRTIRPETLTSFRRPPSLARELEVAVALPHRAPFGLS